MIEKERIPVWKMIVEAIEWYKHSASNTTIRSYINSEWENVNQNTINAQIIVLTVNHPSRIHYPENKLPRIANGQYDKLFRVGRGEVVSYDPKEHGIWEIYQNEFGALGVRQSLLPEDEEVFDFPTAEGSFLFPIEANLRDFLIKNLNTYKLDNLTLFSDKEGRDGKEYPTEVGIIDILANNKNGDFYVFELKLSRGADKALGQLLRYVGWIRANMAKGKKVFGVIVANKMDTKIKYAVSATNDISLFEYELKFELSQVRL